MIVRFMIPLRKYILRRTLKNEVRPQCDYNATPTNAKCTDSTPEDPTGTTPLAAPNRLLQEALYLIKSKLFKKSVLDSQSWAKGGKQY